MFQGKTKEIIKILDWKSSFVAGTEKIDLENWFCCDDDDDEVIDVAIIGNHFKS